MSSRTWGDHHHGRGQDHRVVGPGLESWTPYLTAGNFDGAHLDLIVATDRSVETLHRLRSDGLGGFSYEGKLHASLFTGVMPIVTLDVDGDGDDDIIGAVKPGTPAVKFVKNLGGLTWGCLLYTSDAADE